MSKWMNPFYLNFEVRGIHSFVCRGLLLNHLLVSDDVDTLAGNTDFAA